VEPAVISRGAALGVLDAKPGVWHCIRCWAAVLDASEGDYAALRDIVQHLATEKTNLTYDTVYNTLGAIACEIESPVCEKKVTGPGRYSGWRWSVRRRRGGAR
jgi:hypothetical protein